MMVSFSGFRVDGECPFMISKREQNASGSQIEKGNRLGVAGVLLLMKP